MNRNYYLILCFLSLFLLSSNAKAQIDLLGCNGEPPNYPGFISLGQFTDANGQSARYYLSDSEPLTWPKAQIAAENLGGYLAVIRSQAENDFIQNSLPLIYNLAHIGLHDLNQEGALEWINGDPVIYDNIDPCDFCNDNADAFDVVAMEMWNGNWSWLSEYTPKQFIVEIPCSNDPCLDSDGDGICDTEDCAPFNASLPAPVSTPCDDGNDQTINDQYAAGSCECAGTLIPSEDCVVEDELEVCGCPEDIIVDYDCAEVQTDAQGNTVAAVAVTWSEPTFMSSCGEAFIVSQTHFSGDLFVPGQKVTVEYLLEDNCCNQLVCAFSVEIGTAGEVYPKTDGDSPIAPCPDDIVLVAPLEAATMEYCWDKPIYETNCPCFNNGQVGNAYSVDPNAIDLYMNSLGQDCFTFPLGVTTIRYRFHDGGSGNGGSQCFNEEYCSFSITVTGPNCGSGSGSGDVTYPDICPGNNPAAAGISIDPYNNLHPASSYIIATQRNHVLQNFPDLEGENICPDYNGDAYYNTMLDKYGAIQPQFGQGKRKKLYRFGGTYVDGLICEDFCNVGWHFDCLVGTGKTGPYPYDDFDFYLAEAAQMQADMCITVNYGSGTPEEAKSVVEYVNKTRKLGVRYFEIGNEVNLSTMKGHQNCGGSCANAACQSVTCTEPVYENCPEYDNAPINSACSALDYGIKAAEFIAAMRSVEPETTLKIGIVASIAGEWGGCWYDFDNLENLFTDLLAPMKAAGQMPDFLIFHNYPSYPHAPPTEAPGNVSDLSDIAYAQAVMAQNAWETEIIESIVKPTLEKVKTQLEITHDIGFANTEYFTHVLAQNRPNLTHSALEALYTADNMISALRLDLEMAVNASLYTRPGLNACGEYEDNSFNILFDPCNANDTKAVFQVHEFVANYLGEQVIPSQAFNLGQVVIDNYQNQDQTAYDSVGFVTTKRADGTLVLLAVNRTQEDAYIAIDPNINLASAQMRILQGGTFSNTSNFVESIIGYTDLSQVEFPAASVCILELKPISGKGRQEDLADEAAITQLQVFPNPIEADYRLYVESKEATRGKLIISDASGKVLRIHQLNLQEGSNQFIFSEQMEAPLPVGLLFYTFQSEKYTRSGKLVKLD